MNDNLENLMVNKNVVAYKHIQKYERKKHKRSLSIKISTYNFDVFENEKISSDFDIQVGDNKIKKMKRDEFKLEKINMKNRNYRYLYNLLDSNFEFNEDFKKYKKDEKILG